MKLENAVCSLELSIKLYELGIAKKSIFVWEYENDKCYGLKFISCAVVPCKENKFKLYSAFTVSELGEMLPNYVLLPDAQPFNVFRLFITKFYSVSLDEGLKKTNNFIVNYECDSTETTGKNAFLRRNLTSNFYDPNLANAMARMIIYLIEKGLYEYKN